MKTKNPLEPDPPAWTWPAKADGTNVWVGHGSSQAIRAAGMDVTRCYLEMPWEGESGKSSDFSVSKCRILISFESILCWK